MAQTWYPNPNPGGQTRRFLRAALADWITAQRIQGLDHVYRSKPLDGGWEYDAYPHTGRGFGALVGVEIPNDSENRTAYTGPTDRGGKMFHASTELHLRHRSYDLDSAQDSEGSEDDYDRIIDALKDCLRGVGRDLGHPDVVLAVGEWPRDGNITGHHEPPVSDESSILRVGVVAFDVTLYTTNYPGS